MIGANQEAATAFIESFRNIAGISHLSLDKQGEFEELARSGLSDRFPGGLLPYPQPLDPTIYYAITTTPDDWRRLQPLLMAYAGPTLTSFKGWAEPLSPASPVEAHLLSSGEHVVARLLPGVDKLVTEMVRRSLARMVTTVIDAPATTYCTPPSTNRLISQFVDYLNGNDRLAAERVLEICRTELRVDALNLSFLRIQMLAHFGDWQGIREMSEFSSLCYTRKPPPVAAALLEALYQVHMSQIEGPDWVDRERSVWREHVCQFARPMLRLPIPTTCAPGALKLYAWDALESNPRRRELETAIWTYRDLIGGLANSLEESGRTGAGEASAPLQSQVAPITAVQHAFSEADTSDTLATISDALARFEQLDAAHQKELLESALFRSIWQSLQNETNGIRPPANWSDWFSRLSDDEFTNAFDLLKRAVAEWPASNLIDTAQINDFATALGSVQDIPPASERIADAIPLLTAWVSEDPQFPRAVMAPIYETLLFHLIVGARRAPAVYDSSALLIHALLTIGLPASQYAALLDDCLELVGSGAGTRHVYWLLGVLEETILNTAPNPNHRQAFWYAVHARLLPLRAHLSPGQRLALTKLAASLGWDSTATDAFSAPSDDRQTNELRAALAGKSIGIYSLTESASRQAELALKAITSDIKVSISSDTGGSSALKSIAQNSDILVMVTASATHAATGFIQQMRPRNKPLLFAAGRGFSSILRAIEDYVLKI